MVKYLHVILFSIFIILIGIIGYQYTRANKYKSLYDKELINVEAYRVNNSELNDNIREFKMTIDDLRNSKDSLDTKISEMLNTLKIKDKKIEYLQYNKSIIEKTDTIILPDTIFVNNFALDTIVGDSWYSIGINLRYPSIIRLNPKFISEKYVVIHNKKEFNKKPSKLFFIRWFQKKHTVVEVTVEEKSPYIINKDNKFIKVIK